MNEKDKEIAWLKKNVSPVDWRRAYESLLPLSEQGLIKELDRVKADNARLRETLVEVRTYLETGVAGKYGEQLYQKVNSAIQGIE